MYWVGAASHCEVKPGENSETYFKGAKLDENPQPDCYVKKAICESCMITRLHYSIEVPNDWWLPPFPYVWVVASEKKAWPTVNFGKVTVTSAFRPG